MLNDKCISQNDIIKEERMTKLIKDQQELVTWVCEQAGKLDCMRPASLPTRSQS
ncbi:hypothetical protein [Xanthomonas nasturtii]|uniref:hypothetical protein n=1 Tax=Xanthomonas nasturtii TaxID=1843581 RepID=UPI0013A53E0C|nr:hypothetical protein [Xanthomonas nasturtii]WVL58112.1 hypothetical protein M3O54_007730 [Xanthomonas nasturtii]